MSARPFLLSEQLDAAEFTTLEGRTPDILSRDDAAVAVGEYLSALIEAHAEGERPAVLLSGGIDSQLVAAALVAAGRHPVCITVSAISGSPDVVPAQQGAAALGLPWHLAGFDEEWVRQAAGTLTREFATVDLYDISAALCFERACEVATELGVDEIWTGAGADVLFGAPAPIPGQASHARYWAETFALWRRYLLPVDYDDVYWQLAARHGQRVILAFETAAARTLARRFDGDLLVGDELGKLPLRAAARRLGVPPELTVRPRQEFQVSSGMNEMLYRLAAADAGTLGLAPERAAADADARAAGEEAESAPLSAGADVSAEPPQWIAARYWLALQRDR